jgi:hypothetical protein
LSAHVAAIWIAVKSAIGAS